MSEKYALYEISFTNALMYSRAVPMPGDEKEPDRPLFDASKDACNPENFKNEQFDEEDEIIVKAK